MQVSDKRNSHAQGVNKIGKDAAESKCALVFGQMNEPPGARARVALTGLTIAEYFRDQEGQDVLFFVDNIFRFTQVDPLALDAVIMHMTRDSCQQRCHPTSPLDGLSSGLLVLQIEEW